MKKRALCLILTLCMVVSLLPIGASAAEIVASGNCGAQGDNVTWTLDSNGLLTISGTGEMEDYKDWWYSDNHSPFKKDSRIKRVVIAPGVTGIGNNAFYYCSSLTSITIPDSVTSVGESAFSNCSSLTDITIPDSVTSIGESAFSDCGSLTSITIPDSVTSIMESTFCRCSSLTSITIPDSVTSIGNNAFFFCSSLIDITIPDSVTSITSNAFYSCSSLTSITIPDGVTVVEDSVFEKCSSLTSITIPDSVTSIETEAFSECSCLAEIMIPNSVTSIGDRAFYYCRSLTSITIPDSVTSIGDSAFYYCFSLTSITIPDSVTSIGDPAFRSCRSLSSIDVDPGNSAYSSIDGALFDKDQNTLFCYPSGKGSTSYKIPSSVTSIGGNAFSECSSLTSITIPDSVTSIGGYAFNSCSSMTSITIPDGVTSIGGNAFNSCSSLISITIPDSVTGIGYGTFYKCRSLASITIPDSVTSIEESAFYDCDYLMDVYYGGSEAQWNAVSVGSKNDPLKNATIHFTAAGPDDPAPSFSFYFLDEPHSLSPVSEFQPYAILEGSDGVVGGYVEFEEDMEDAAAFSKIQWTVSDPSVAEIRSAAYNDGLLTGITSLYWTLNVKGLRPGTVTISGKTDDGREAVSGKITVEPKLTAVGDSDVISGKTKVTLCKVELPEGDQDYLAPFLKTLKVDADEKILILDDMSYGILADGKTGYLNCEAIPAAAGAIPYTVTSPGGQSVTGTIQSNYFNELIYRAAYLNSDQAPAETLRNFLLRSTPSDLLTESGEESGLDASLAAWKGVSMALDAYDDPSSLVDTVIGPKDVYTGLIMSVLKASASTDLINDTFEDYAKNCKGLISFCNDFMKEKHKLDLMDPKAFTKMTPEECKDLSDCVDGWFKKEHPFMNGTGKVLAHAKRFLDGVGTVEDYYDLLMSYITISGMTDHMRTALQQAYTESLKTNNSYLQAALWDCKNVLNGDLIGPFIEQGVFAIGKTSARWLFKELFWEGVKDSINPAATFIMTIGSGAKDFTNFLFGTDDIQEAYYNLQAVRQVEAVFKGAQQSLREQFAANSTEDSAGAYLNALELAFNAMDVDCDQAYDFVDTVDSVRINQLIKLFGGSDYNEKKQSIRNLQAMYRDEYQRDTAQWLPELKNGYNPFTDAYDYTFSPVTKNDNDPMVWRIKIACPVDVYVYDASDNLAASVVNGVLSCTDENLMIALVGDEKTVQIFDDEAYRVECIGTDKGTMDVTVEKYDDAEEPVYTASYENLALTDGKQYDLIPSSEQEPDALCKLIDAGDQKTVKPAYDTASDPKHTISMKDGTFSFDGNVALQGKVPAGATVTVTTEEPDGYTFTGWTSDVTVAFADKTALTTTFVMPKSDVTVQATFTKADPTPTTEPTQPTTKPADPTPASPQPTTKPDDTKPSPKPDDTKPSPKPDDTKPSPKPIQNPFTDVTSGDYFYDPVLWALNHEPQITDGMTETTFAPGETCTRGQVVTFLWRAMGCVEPKKTDNPFADVSGGDYFYKAVLWAVEKGITDGTSATTFSPADPCTRAHVVTFLHRAEGTPAAGSKNPFADVAAGEYYTNAVLWAVEKGITDGTSDTTFSPAAPCTRGQIVTFLYRDMK